MKYIFKMSILLYLGLWVGSVHAVEFSIEEGENNSLCKTVYANIIEEINQENKYYKLNQVIPGDLDIKWKRSYYHLKSRKESSYKSKQKIRIARVDIDNDGSLETLVFDSYMLKNQLGDLLYIMEKGSEYTEILSKGTILNADRWLYKGLKSAPDWPYGDLGIYSPQIQVFSIQGRNFIAMKDGYFGSNRTERAFSGRALVLAEYAGKEIPFRKEGAGTIKLEVFCKISSGVRKVDRSANSLSDDGAE